jgi:hypothetical protein
MEALEHDQPDHHPGTQRPLARKLPSPCQKVGHPLLAHRLMVSLEGPGQRRLLSIIDVINGYWLAILRPTQ